ncbi:single-stranded DNA-binding protein [Streptomyces sp. SL13]|uniref:Single-stranded DNA-binding protein n=1 Tax=Streptantibioticus silvisoli TaxID=2705255 RepID=A0AA90H9L3_9ACTN|nr:single-stranded DNA-binding protein [Streptantibioticus silvisoli]MDI5973705.1 single-stranded DNA-binding protein [Streptantibioticus silvisoli]
MSETLVTVTGNVATSPELRTTSAGVPVARFRVATTERRYDRSAERWTDGHTNFFTVWAWRSLGENVSASLGIGEPVIVQGRLRVTEREEKGQTYFSASVDAVAIGHDLNRGTAAFRRVAKNRADWASDPFATPLDPTAPDEPSQLPTSAPRATPVEVAAAVRPDPAPPSAAPARSTARKRAAAPARSADPVFDPELVPS